MLVDLESKLDGKSKESWFSFVCCMFCHLRACDLKGVLFECWVLTVG